jgi:hypothetical protein
MERHEIFEDRVEEGQLTNKQFHAILDAARTAFEAAPMRRRQKPRCIKRNYRKGVVNANL